MSCLHFFNVGNYNNGIQDFEIKNGTFEFAHFVKMCKNVTNIYIYMFFLIRNQFHYIISGYKTFNFPPLRISEALQQRMVSGHRPLDDFNMPTSCSTGLQVNIQTSGLF